MNHVIIKPLIAEKFQMAMENGRIIFFSAPCGFGKTTTATNLLKPYKVRALSADDVDFTVPLVPDGSWDVLLIDQFQFLKDTEQQALCELIRNNPQSRFVFFIPRCAAGISGTVSIFRANARFYRAGSAFGYYQLSAKCSKHTGSMPLRQN